MGNIVKKLKNHCIRPSICPKGVFFGMKGICILIIHAGSPLWAAGRMSYKSTPYDPVYFLAPPLGIVLYGLSIQSLEH